MTTTEDNKTIVAEFIQALFTKGDLDAVDHYLAEDFVNNDPPFGASADREGTRTGGALFRSVFPDWRAVPAGARGRIRRRRPRRRWRTKSA